MSAGGPAVPVQPGAQATRAQAGARTASAQAGTKTARVEARKPRARTRIGAQGASLNGRGLAAIFLGGAVGALARVWLAVTFAPAPASWPWPTFAVNVTGCFALGWLATRLREPVPRPSPILSHPLLATGFCAAYSTFATMQVELLRMLERGHYGLATGYAAASVTAGYVAIRLAANPRHLRDRPDAGS